MISKKKKINSKHLWLLKEQRSYLCPFLAHMCRHVPPVISLASKSAPHFFNTTRHSKLPALAAWCTRVLFARSDIKQLISKLGRACSSSWSAFVWSFIITSKRSCQIQERQKKFNFLSVSNLKKIIRFGDPRVSKMKEAPGKSLHCLVESPLEGPLSSRATEETHASTLGKRRKKRMEK